MMKFHFINENKIIFCHNQVFCCIGLLLILLMSSCQKKTQITIYAGDSLERPSTNDLQAVDGNYQEALERCRNKLQQVKKNSVEEADIYNVMGGIYAEYLLDRENALLYINKAIEIHQSQADGIGLAHDYTAMSNICIYIGGDAEIGLEYLEKAEQLYDECGSVDSFGLAEVLISKGQLYLKETLYDNALQELIKAQKIYDKRQENSIVIYLLTGQVYLEKREYKLSEEQYLKALQICQNKKDEYNISRVNFQLGWLYSRMKKYDKAIESYNQSLIFTQTSDIYMSEQANIYNNISLCYTKLMENKKAFEYSISACQIIEQGNPKAIDNIEDKKIYKHNLSVCWSKWYDNTSRTEFDNWYQNVVIEEMDWKNYSGMEIKSQKK